MRFSFFSVSSFAIIAPLVLDVVASPVIARDKTHTIWAEDTIAVMKEQRAKLFGVTNELYKLQKHYNNHINCDVPEPPPEFRNGTQKCANANQVRETFR